MPSIKTVEQLATDVRNLVSDSRLDVTIIMGWFKEFLLNNALIIRKQGMADIALVAGTATYAAPSDMLLPFALFLPGATKPSTPASLTDRSTTGYVLWSNQITIRPTPTESGTAALLYMQRPTLPSSVSEYLDVPAPFENVPVLYAAAKSQSRDEELDEKVDYYTDYLRGCKALDNYTAKLIRTFTPTNWVVNRGG